MKTPQYITTTLPYVNSKPHVGFAMEIIRADALARYYTLSGHEVFFNTGTDEHGVKIYENAQAANLDPQSYVDPYAEDFKGLIELLHLKEDIHFIRTTDEHHIKAAQSFWQRCNDNGYIYKKSYQAKYCVGCELYKTDSELVDGKCPIHPNREIEIIDEENYFFKFSKCENFLKELYKERPDFVVPDFRFNEIKSFVDGGLQDFSISRLKTKMPWGIPVPGDDEHVMYVWFDALVNYISTLGWDGDLDTFEKFWIEGKPIQYAGKDNLRQQSAMWQSMLHAAGLPNSHQIIINGFINSGGQKMSKSLGNVIDPYDIVEKYGAEALRYYLLRHMNSFEDSDMTMEKFHEAYNANLANGLGNLVQRLMKMITSYEVDISDINFDHEPVLSFHSSTIEKERDFNKMMDEIWRLIGDMDQFIAEHKPFKKIKEDPETAHRDLKHLATELSRLAISLYPVMPETAATIQNCLTEVKIPEQPLFVRMDS
ncbi:MAG: methionine--tRNA ligase [Candidatus Pacebacteria bacterium]|nr:methionine--tRNA ligase [Candidatus Paceibacterota bacterium]